MSEENEEIMYLLRPVDTDATIEKCKHHLKVTLPRMIRTSGQDVASLKSPSMDGMPKAPSYKNNADSTIVRRLAAEQIVRRTIEAISNCDATAKQVLSFLYLDQYTDTMCYMAIGYSRSHYFDVIKPDALLQFADTYMLEDLHVYQEK